MSETREQEDMPPPEKDREQGDAPRHTYVDRRTARDVQSKRVGSAPPPQDGPDDVEGAGGFFQRLRRLLGGRSSASRSAAGAFLLLAAVGCESADQTDATTSPSPTSTAAAPSPTEGSAPTVSRCEDEEDDLVVFEDGAPTDQPASATGSDTTQVTLIEDDFGFRITGSRAEGGPAGSSDAQLELHLREAGGGAAGVVVLGFPSGPGQPFDISVGPSTDELHEVETLASNIGHTSASATMSVEDLPVSPPFEWYFVTPEGDVGDVCPNVTGFDDGQLPVFPPEDGEDT
ncbi:MAG: hypothetical protein R3343_05430 [Nitriliruptorales bacterium]|nr:hypothetical protein [Nitriliruptorales bacterium]